MLHLQSDEHDATTAYETFLRPPQRRPRTICVFGGAALGLDPRLRVAAESLGLAIAVTGLKLVYGGGSSGLMGAIAQVAAENGGDVIAIAPRFLVDRQDIGSDFGELIVTPCMHTRKRLMFDHADAFVALPGGIGTIDELAEVMTWSKLDQHCKPIVIANFEGFWTPWLALLNHLEGAGFLRAGTAGRCLVADKPEAVLPLIMGASHAIASFNVGKDAHLTH
jgi:uncharacterized protein (TIGR00730 family)